MEVREIPVADIKESMFNMRSEKENGELIELTESIKRTGLLNPITVAESTDETFTIITGRRRLAAYKVLGHTHIPAVIADTLSDEEFLEMQIVENTQRKDVTPLEEADGYRELAKTGNYTIEDIAKKVAKSAVHVARTLSLLKLAKEFRKVLKAGKLDIEAAYLLARMPTHIQDEFIHSVGTDPSIEQVKRWSAGTSTSLKKTLFPQDVEYAGVHPCTKCENNTVNSTLFEGGKAHCTDPACFAQKCEEALGEKLVKEKAIAVSGLGKNRTKFSDVTLQDNWKEANGCKHAQRAIIVDHYTPEHIGKVLDVCLDKSCKHAVKKEAEKLSPAEDKAHQAALDAQRKAKLVRKHGEALFQMLYAKVVTEKFVLVEQFLIALQEYVLWRMDYLAVRKMATLLGWTKEDKRNEREFIAQTLPAGEGRWVPLCLAALDLPSHGDMAVHLLPISKVYGLTLADGKRMHNEMATQKANEKAAAKAKAKGGKKVKKAKKAKRP